MVLRFLMPTADPGHTDIKHRIQNLAKLSFNKMWQQNIYASSSPLYLATATGRQKRHVSCMNLCISLIPKRLFSRTNKQRTTEGD